MKKKRVMKQRKKRMERAKQALSAWGAYSKDVKLCRELVEILVEHVTDGGAVDTLEQIIAERDRLRTWMKLQEIFLDVEREEHNWWSLRAIYGGMLFYTNERWSFEEAQRQLSQLKARVVK